MKKFVFVSAILLSAIVGMGLLSCQSTKSATDSRMLKFNLENGKGYDYEMVWDLDTKVSGQESNVSITGLYSMNIASIDNNIRTISMFYKSFRMHMKMMGVEMELDSDKPIRDTGVNASKNPLTMMNKVISGIVGKKFNLKVDEEGNLLEVTGFERIINDMVDSMDLDESTKLQVMASMKDQFNDQTIKDQFAQIFTIFPNKEVKVGDTWDKSYSTGGKMAAKYTTTYTVKEIEGDHVTMATQTRISSDKDSKDISGTQTGNVTVDSKTGLMTNAEFDQDMEVKAEGQTVQVTGKGRIRGKAN